MPMNIENNTVTVDSSDSDCFVVSGEVSCEFRDARMYDSFAKSEKEFQDNLSELVNKCL